MIYALINSLGVLFYILLVAWILFSGEKIFGQMANYWGPVAFLLLFCLSAAAVGAMIFGRSVYLYLDGLKSEAIAVLAYTLVFLLILTVAALAINLG
ncbi:hypothetical protein KKD72_01390 [Patescibacteria group bacterium]|nr:hypothetical protein [Patescibacteria group bacterium]